MGDFKGNNDGAGSGGELSVAQESWVSQNAALATTDNTITRFDGASGLLQGSGILIDDSNNLLLVTSDGGALGSSSIMWSDLFLANGAVINFNSDITITHSTDVLAFAGGSYSFAGAITPALKDGSALGSATLQFSDLFLALGAVINFDNGDVTITHAANAVTVAGGTFNATGGGALTGTWSDLGTVTTVDINGGTVDGVTIGGSSAGAITGTTITANTGFMPDANDGAYLGQAGTAFADLFLAEGGVINWDSGDATLTQTGNVLALAGAALSLDSKISTYNNITTAGWGVPGIYGSGAIDATVDARSAAVATYTVGAADGDFEVGGFVLVTTSTTHSFSLDVSYTDTGNTARTLILPMAQLAGAFVTGGLITNVTGAGPYESPIMHIRAKAATAITIRPSAGTFTTVTYNVSAVIKQVA